VPLRRRRDAKAFGQLDALLRKEQRDNRVVMNGMTEEKLQFPTHRTIQPAEFALSGGLTLFPNMKEFTLGIVPAP